jgi:hypothetical protein
VWNFNPPIAVGQQSTVVLQVQFPHPIEGATGFVGEFVLLSVEAGFPLDLKQGSDRIKADTSFPVHGATVTPSNTKKPPLPTSIWPNGKAYFFRGAEYVSYDARADTADAGYPQPILGHWLGFPEEFSGGIDTEVLWNNGKAYFFKGTQYLRYDVATSRVDEGYPQSIRVNWRGMWDSDIDAVVWPNGKAYFFRGPQYIRYDITSDKADEGYPQDIKANWHFPASFMDGIDGAVMWNNGKAYFFKGDQYIRYDVATDKTDEGPMPIAGHWPGLWEK